jgi:hypothetical protein
MCIQNSVTPVTCNIKYDTITNKFCSMRSEILTAVLMKIQVSLDVIQCQQVNSYISAGTSTRPRTSGP